MGGIGKVTGFTRCGRKFHEGCLAGCFRRLNHKGKCQCVHQGEGDG